LYSTAIFSQFKIPVSDTIESKLLVEERVELLQSQNKGKEKIGKKVPVIKAMDINGVLFDSEKTKKVTFYNFWFTDCSPCIEEAPLMNRIKNQYNEKVDFVSVTFDKK
jgi:thiol-disulfide isomerase/thioredoxin